MLPHNLYLSAKHGCIQRVDSLHKEGSLPSFGISYLGALAAGHLRDHFSKQNANAPWAAAEGKRLTEIANQKGFTVKPTESEGPNVFISKRQISWNPSFDPNHPQPPGHGDPFALAHEIGHGDPKGSRAFLVLKHLAESKPARTAANAATIARFGLQNMAHSAEDPSEKTKLLRTAQTVALGEAARHVPTLLEEGRATGRALRAAHKRGQFWDAFKSLGPAFGHYAAVASEPLIDAGLMQRQIGKLQPKSPAVPPPVPKPPKP